MKRLYLAAVLGLWPGAAQAQEGLAPTVPVVPAPVLQNGNVQAPAGSGWGTPGGPRFLSVSKWSPFRNPATASPIEPTAPVSTHPLPPLPAGISTPEMSGSPANCGPAGCGRPARSRSCWERIKLLLGYHDSPTELPKLRPTPCITPLQGMFPCTAAPGCGTGCAAGHNGGVPQMYAPAHTPPMMPAMPAVTTPTGTTAGAVVMPPRGMQGRPVQPVVQGRVVPESAVTAKPAPGTLVPAGYLRPAPK